MLFKIPATSHMGQWVNEYTGDCIGKWDVVLLPDIKDLSIRQPSDIYLRLISGSLLSGTYVELLWYNVYKNGWRPKGICYDNIYVGLLCFLVENDIM